LRSRFRGKDNLVDTASVTKVNKEHASMVSQSIDPSGKSYFLSRIG